MIRGADSNRRSRVRSRAGWGLPEMSFESSGGVPPPSGGFVENGFMNALKLKLIMLLALLALVGCRGVPGPPVPPPPPGLPGLPPPP